MSSQAENKSKLLITSSCIDASYAFGRIPDKDLLSVDDLANFLGIKRRTIHQWTYKGRISRVKAGRKVLFKRKDVLDFIERGYRPDNNQSRLERLGLVAKGVKSIEGRKRN